MYTDPYILHRVVTAHHRDMLEAAARVRDSRRRQRPVTRRRSVQLRSPIVWTATHATATGQRT